jgi:hypothetical protein
MLDTIGYQALAPGAGGAAAAAAPGDALTIRNARQGSKILLLEAIACNLGVGWHQIICPTGNDTTRDIRFVVPIGQPRGYLSNPVGESLQPQDILAVTIAGSAVATNWEQGCLLIYYEDLPGVSGRFIDTPTLRTKCVRLVTIQATLATGVLGGWSGAELITAETDLLRANTDYAVLGMTTRINCCALGMRAPDWGNLRISTPGNALDGAGSNRWFSNLSDRFGLPLIPIFNSGNRGNIFIEALQDEGGVDPIMNVLLAELTA